MSATPDGRNCSVLRLDGRFDENGHKAKLSAGAKPDYYACMPLTFTRLRTPVGELILTASDAALTGVFFPTSRRGPAPTHQAGWVEATTGPAADVLARARQQLEEYFARTRTSFELPLEAVAIANGRNPIPIIVPCHRVVGAKGELTGFGGGLDTKRWLLEHEGALMELGV